MLGVDAVVVGAVTDFTPYLSAALAMQVEWYAANPCFQPIPAGYGLPWGTPGRRTNSRPAELEAGMALARAQLKTQTPAYTAAPMPMPPPILVPTPAPSAPGPIRRADGPCLAGRCPMRHRASSRRSVDAVKASAVN